MRGRLIQSKSSFLHWLPCRGFGDAIKRALGKLTAPADLREALQSCGFTKRNITPAPALATESQGLHGLLSRDGELSCT